MKDVVHAGLENEIQACTTVEQAIDGAFGQASALKRHSKNMAYSLFFLGGYLSQAESLADWGSGFFEHMKRELGVGIALLRQAMNWYDLHEGDTDVLEATIKGTDMSRQHITRLLSLNKDRVKSARTQRRYEHRMLAANKQPRVKATLPPLRKNPLPNSEKPKNPLLGIPTLLRNATKDVSPGTVAEVKTFTQEGKTYRVILELVDANTQEGGDDA